MRLEDVIDAGEDQDWWDPDQLELHYRMMSDLHRRQVDDMLSNGEARVGTAFRRTRQGVVRVEVRFDGLAGCLRTLGGGSSLQFVVVVREGRLRMRGMSPREYARLQGAPNFTANLPYRQLLSGFGDAVCVPAVAWIDQHVLTPLFEAALARREEGGDPAASVQGCGA